jgi:Cu2+-exporting ATPase
MIGGAAMAFSSVSVVSNSLRLKRKKISLIPRGNEVRIEEVEPINKKVMKKRFTIDGMMCGHCRAHVEEALNSIDGVKAIVTLDPPEATIEFADKEISLNELQQIVQNKAGDYKLHDSK